MRIRLTLEEAAKKYDADPRILKALYRAGIDKSSIHTRLRQNPGKDNNMKLLHSLWRRIRKNAINSGGDVLLRARANFKKRWPMYNTSTILNKRWPVRNLIGG